jgi:hypothetical protein
MLLQHCLPIKELKVINSSKGFKVKGVLNYDWWLPGYSEGKCLYFMLATEPVWWWFSLKKLQVLRCCCKQPFPQVM